MRETGLMRFTTRLIRMRPPHRAETTQWLDDVYRALPNAGVLLAAPRLFDFLQWAVWLGNPSFAWGTLLLTASALVIALSVTGRLSVGVRQWSALASPGASAPQRRADQASGLALSEVTASGSEPDARSAMVTLSRTERRLALTATQTWRRDSEGGG